MKQDLGGVLCEGVRKFGLGLSQEKVDAFDFFLKELMRWNQKMNLTSLRDPRDIIVKHFLDSLAVSPYLSPGCSLVDVGSGAGFPCIVLKISDPSLQVTSIDSSRKKISFQRHMIRQLRLDQINTIHAHLPDPRVAQKFHKSFDYAISRAFGGLGDFLRIARPFMKRDGILISMKGKMELKEVLEDKSIAHMNMELHKTITYTLPSAEANRTLFFFIQKGGSSHGNGRSEMPRGTSS